MKNMMRVLGIIALAAVMGFSMAACDTGNNSGGSGDGTGGEATELTLNQPTLTLAVGGRATLTVTAKKSVNWSSVNPSVAAVDANGTVIGVAVGSATIIAVSMDGKFATCDVTVSAEAAPITGVSLNKTSLSLLVGGSDTLTAAVTPADASNKAVNWTSTNPNVAIVDSNGTVIALSLGLTIIVATTEDGGKTATCAVSVIEEAAVGAIAVTGVSLNPATLLLEVGTKGTLTATVQPANATNKALNWDSSNHDIVEVGTNGSVTAKGSGKATIYVQTVEGGHIASAVITVNASQSTAPSTLSAVNKYVAIPYTGGNIPARAAALTDSIKYSYSYENYDFYYIYLGELKNIPLFYHTPKSHDGMNSSYTVSNTAAEKKMVSETVRKSSETVLDIVDTYTTSSASGGKISGQVGVGIPIFWGLVKVELAKVKADVYWNDYIQESTASNFRQTTSLENSVTTGTEFTEKTMISERWNFTKDDKAGYYRYTLFSDSDVYLFVMRDSQSQEIYCEFREHVIPDTYYWKLDYSETLSFTKTDTSHFEFDVSQLNNLPKPELSFDRSSERMEYSTAGKHTYTFDKGFPATVEVYVLGAGGGGQGGHHDDHLPWYAGTGAAGGGGAAAYMKFSVEGPGVVAFNDITVGQGGRGAGGFKTTIFQSWRAGTAGGHGGDTSVTVTTGSTTTTLTALGGSGGGSSNRDKLPGGAGGTGGIVDSMLTSLLDWDTQPGNAGSNGEQKKDLRSTNRGGAAAIIEKGSEDSFGGGLGAISGTGAEPGGGGNGGYDDTRMGVVGGNGLVVIVVTY